MRHPWLVKAMGRWNPNDHPRGQPENAGEFADAGGGGSGAAPAASSVDRTNPLLDDFFAQPSAPKPKPAADIRSNGPDIFDPQETLPRPGPSGGKATRAARPGADPKAAALTRQFRDVAAQHARQGKLAGLNGDKVTAKRHRMIAAEYRRVAGFHSLGEHEAADAARRRAERLFGLDSTATPPELPQRAPGRANGSPGGAGTPSGSPAPQGAPQRSSGPATHERTQSAALDAVNEIPKATSPEGRRLAHQNAVAALDLHLKAGLAELKRRASKAGSRSGNMYRKAKEAFTAKLSAARRRVDEMAGRGPPPVPGQGGQAPPAASRRAAPPGNGPRRPPPLPGAAGRQLEPWVPLKAFHPWLAGMVAKAADAGGRWITIGGTKGKDGKRHGGSPVYIKNGRIVKGHPSLTGKKIASLQGWSPHQQELEDRVRFHDSESDRHHAEAQEHRADRGNNREKFEHHIAESDRHSDEAKKYRRMRGQPESRHALVDDPDYKPTHRQQLNQARGYDQAAWRKKARKAGHDPKHLDQLAADIKAHHDSFAAERKEVLQYARNFSAANGYGDLRKRGRDRFVGASEDNQRGIDETAESTAKEFPHHFRDETAATGGSHEDQLREMLSHDDPQPMTHAEAYEHAFEQLGEPAPKGKRRPKAADDSFDFGANAKALDLSLPPRHPWFTKTRDATGHEHAADGRFGATAGSHGGKGGTATRRPSSPAADRHANPRPPARGDADAKARSLAARIGEVPRKLRHQVRSFARGRYRRLSRRYGPKGAMAILAMMLILLPAPLPGTSLIPIVVAEIILGLRRITKSHGELDPATIRREAAALLRDLYTACGEKPPK